MSAPAARRGRRPGGEDTRGTILAAARRRFADHGFAGTSVRAVAADAAVDPALVHHYFGTKSDLFLAALELPVDPRQVLVPVAAGGPDGAGERLLRAFLSVWEDPGLQVGLVAFVRGLLEQHEEQLFGQGFLPVVLGPVGEALGIDRPDLRMPLVATQMIGLVLGRYVLRIEPLAAMSAEDVVTVLGPTLQRYLTGPLP